MAGSGNGEKTSETGSALDGQAAAQAATERFVAATKNAVGQLDEVKLHLVEQGPDTGTNNVDWAYVKRIADGGHLDAAFLNDE